MLAKLCSSLEALGEGRLSGPCKLEAESSVLQVKDRPQLSHCPLRATLTF